MLATAVKDDMDMKLKRVGLGDTFEGIMDIMILNWLFQIHEPELKLVLMNTLWKKKGLWTAQPGTREYNR